MLPTLVALAALLAVAAAAPAVPGVNTTMAFTTNATWPYAHNSGWALLPSGRIVVVLQASRSVEGAASQVIFIATSDDGGATFPAPPRVLAGGNASVWGPVAYADGDTLRVFFARAPASDPTRLCGDLMHIASPDGGLTWSAPELMLAQGAWGSGAICPDNKPARVGADQWALPVMAMQNGTSGLLAARPGAGMAGPWAPLAGSIPPPPQSGKGTYFPEPAIASCAAAAAAPGQAPGSALLALLRNYERTWAARSSNGGASWGAPFQTQLANPYSKVDLAVWQGGGASAPAGPQPGALLLAHNPVVNCTEPVYCPRTPLAVSWSQDCGAAWSRPLLLEPTPLTPRGASYPTVGACGSSRVCVSYTLYGDGPSGCAGIRFAAFDVSLLAPLADQ